MAVLTPQNVAVHRKHTWDKNVFYSAQGILLSWFFVRTTLLAWIGLFLPFFCPVPACPLRRGQATPSLRSYPTSSPWPCISVITWLVLTLPANGSVWDHEFLLFRGGFGQFCSCGAWLSINILRKCWVPLKDTLNSTQGTVRACKRFLSDSFGHLIINFLLAWQTRESAFWLWVGLQCLLNPTWFWFKSEHVWSETVLENEPR